MPSRSLRSASERCITVPSQRGTKSLSLTFSLTVPIWWNDLPNSIRAAEYVRKKRFGKRFKSTKLSSLSHHTVGYLLSECVIQKKNRKSLQCSWLNHFSSFNKDQFIFNLYKIISDLKKENIHCVFCWKEYNVLVSLWKVVSFILR